MIDDQTVPTREAIGLLANNAVLGLLLVLVTTWLFLGTRIAIFTALGIPVALAALATMFAVAASAVASGMVRMDFFAADTLRLFYVNVEMPPATPLEDTLAKTHESRPRSGRGWSRARRVRSRPTPATCSRRPSPGSATSTDRSSSA